MDLNFVALTVGNVIEPNKAGKDVVWHNVEEFIAI